jgi:hypothetical protein
VTAVVCALAIGNVEAAEDLQLKRDGHPRLEATGEELAEYRGDELRVAQARSLADKVIAKTRTIAYADYFVALPKCQPPPAHDDGWPYWTDLCAELRRDMETTARAWALTGERKYLGWCRELMIAVSQWPQWTDPDYGNGQPGLDTHSLTLGMCVAWDYLHADLPERDRDHMRRAIAEKGARFIHEYGQRDGSYVQQPGLWPNGFAMIDTALGMAALALMGEDERAQEWLDAALDKARLFMREQGGVDGGLVEGLAYGSAAVDSLTYLLQAADDVAGVNLFDEPYLAQAIYFPLYFVAPGGGSVANFGDNGGPEGCAPTLLGTASAIMRTQQSPEAAWYLKQAGLTGETIERLATAPTHLPLARHFRDINWVAMRTGWGPRDTLLALRSGAAAHHNHRDLNSIIVAWGREWLLTDPGYQIYNRPYPAERNMSEQIITNRHAYTSGTVGHNALLVDGRGQIARDGAVTEFVTTPAMSCLTADASQAYGPTVQTCLRRVVSVAPDYYVVFDRVVTDGAERTVETLLHTGPSGRFTVAGTGLKTDTERVGNEARVRGREGEVAVRFTHPSEVTFTHRRLPDCETYGHFLSVATPPAADQTICWALAAGPAGQVRLDTRPVDADEGVTALQVRVGAATDTLALNPTGGEVRVGEMRLRGAWGLVRGEGRDLPRYALVSGTALTYGSRELVTSDAPVTVGAVVDGGTFEASVTCEGPTTVTLHCPVRAATVEVGGVSEVVEVTLDEAGETVTLTAPAGRYELTVRAM